MAEKQTAPFRIASAFPGRIRLQLMPRQAHSGRLESCARWIEALAGAQEVRLAQDAASVILHFDRRRPLDDVLRDVETIAAEVTRTSQPFYSNVTPPLPADQLARVRNASALSHQPQRDSVALSKELPLLDTAPGHLLEWMAQDAKGQIDTQRARDLLTAHQQGGPIPLLISTAAVIASVIDGLPTAIVGSVLALAVMPILRRAGRGALKRQITVDVVDAANIGLLAFQGNFFMPAIISWLISLGELIRGKTVAGSRQDIERIGALPRDQARQAAAVLAAAPLSDTVLQDFSARLDHSLTGPVWGLATSSYVLTRDPGTILGIIKPQADFDSVLRLAAPTPILSALAEAARSGALITSGRALEKLDLTDAVLFTTTGATGRNGALRGLAETLRDRGIRQIVFPSGRRMGGAKVSAAQMAGLADRLRAEGYTVAVVADDPKTPALRNADVRILLGSATEQVRQAADLILLEGDPAALPRALDVARESMRVARQNTIMMAGAALFNLAASVLRVAPPPTSTAINTATVAAIGLNTRRMLAATGASPVPGAGGASRNAPALPAGKGAA